MNIRRFITSFTVLAFGWLAFWVFVSSSFKNEQDSAHAGVRTDDVDVLDAPTLDRKLGWDSEPNRESQENSSQDKDSRPRDPRVRELIRLEKCYLDESCNIEVSGPYDFHSDVAAAMVKELAALKQAAIESQHLPSTSLVAARHFMRFPDDDVKEASLALLAMAVPSQDTFAAISNGLRDSVSARLYRQAVPILERYRETAAQEGLEVFVIDTIRSGGHFVSAEAARLSLGFMTDENAPRFAALAGELQPRSQAREFLLMNLREFTRIQKGG